MEVTIWYGPTSGPRKSVKCHESAIQSVVHRIWHGLWKKTPIPHCIGVASIDEVIWVCRPKQD